MKTSINKIMSYAGLLTLAAAIASVGFGAAHADSSLGVTTFHHPAVDFSQMAEHHPHINYPNRQRDT